MFTDYPDEKTTCFGRNYPSIDLQVKENISIIIFNPRGIHEFRCAARKFQIKKQRGVRVKLSCFQDKQPRASAGLLRFANAWEKMSFPLLKKCFWRNLLFQKGVRRMRVKMKKSQLKIKEKCLSTQQLLSSRFVIPLT